MAMLSLGSHLAIFGGAAVFFDSHQTSDRRTQEHILQKGFAFSSIKRNVLIRENTKELITSWIQNRFAPKVKRVSRERSGGREGKGQQAPCSRLGAGSCMHASYPKITPLTARVSIALKSARHVTDLAPHKALKLTTWRQVD